MTRLHDNWAAGDAYESYMGRWSRPLARAFMGWLAPQPGAHWLEVGCGTGALTGTICRFAEPASVVACDPSESFIDHARKATQDERVSFVVVDSEALPERPGGFDYVVSALLLNFLADPARGVIFMRQRLRRRGMVAAYVWDYGGGLEFLRCFWDEAVALDSAAADVDEGSRFPLCQPEALHSLFVRAGLQQVAGAVLEIPTWFDDFQDYWAPFLRGTGPAPAYVASLLPARRDLLRDRLSTRLNADADGGIQLKARAWTVGGVLE